MKIPQNELIAILSQFNPWWRGAKISDLPTWQRGAFQELMHWIEAPPAPRAVLLSGPRQVGKTTLLLQAIQKLLDSGVPAGNILYTTFDHPICKLAGLDAVLEAWREREPKVDGPEYLFLDEAQFIKQVGTWIKHQVDFSKSRRIVYTGSAIPLIQNDPESGVGRSHILRLGTLSFFEYLQIKNIRPLSIPPIASLSKLFAFEKNERLRLSEAAQGLIGHFHEYLIRGGFPQTALIESITQAQRLLREDIVDKVLKRDMTALFGVRSILELEQMFIYLCMHDGGMLDTTVLSKELQISKPTVQNFIDLFVSTYLIYRLPPFGYGKEVLRGKSKLYLSDPAIGPAVLLKGKSILEDSIALGQCVETAIVGHLWAHSSQARMSYWRNAKEKEIDLVMEAENRLIPLEVKYHSQMVQPRDLTGLIEFCQERTSVKHGYAITKSLEDFGPFQEKIMRVPAVLFCYWLGASGFRQQNPFA